MKFTDYRKWLSCSILAGLLVGPFQAELRAAETDLLVFPNRKAVVRMAFDLHALRDMSMLVYEPGLQDPSQPFMHVWDKASNDWRKTDIDEFRAGNSLPVQSERIFVLGTESATTELLTDAAAWCPDITPVPSLLALDVIKAVNSKLSFSEKEWKHLARTYELKIVDVNAERRRTGRYDAPPPEDVKENPLLLQFRNLRKKEAEPVEESSIAEEETAEPAAANETTATREPEQDASASVAPGAAAAAAAVESAAPAPAPVEEVKPTAAAEVVMPEDK